MLNQDWEERYIHPDFWKATLDGVDIAQPCPDVYMFPLFTHQAADTLVEIMEDYGQWSGGKNKVNFSYHIKRTERVNHK